MKKIDDKTQNALNELGKAAAKTLGIEGEQIVMTVCRDRNYDWCGVDDGDEIPVGWQEVSFGDDELDALCEAADLNQMEEAEGIVDAAYERLFGEQIN